MKFRSLSALAGLVIILIPAGAMAAPTVIDHAAVRERSLAVLESQFGTFRTSAHRLADASRSYCSGDLDRASFLQSFRSTWLDWAPIDMYQFGPVEQSGAALTIGFYPDKKDFVGRGLKALLALPEADLNQPETIATASAGAQGLPAIERLMFSDMSECPAIIGISAHIGNMSDTLYDEWFEPNGWADLARSAGPDNPIYQTEAEFTKALHASVDFGLSRIADTRLGRPLGTYAHALPTQAEARRSGLSLDIINAQLSGIVRLLDEGLAYDFLTHGPYQLTDEIRQTERQIQEFDTPLDALITENAMSRFRVESLQNRVRLHQHYFNEDIGQETGMTAGFSAADGD